ncbi:hypothetical protein [Phorcysia thermohydrogeniphila]|uniref:Uncharacterized protein n=1 Tax=Phorcysia thermohydrogeniphila TaxID=936138 RepID=A0A4R1GPG3_9BACT|nr:hypothetical protein [Phorcysia thermohydrogeniphila]TCK06352.1 hypothetical protein CLV27_0153 [Phorcysia thermohydrogeniphila]
MKLKLTARMLKVDGLIQQNYRGELTEEELRQATIETLNYLTDEFFYREAQKRGGYKNMGEILVDAQQGDEDAKYLLSLYEKVWAVEEEAEKQVSEAGQKLLLKIAEDVRTFLLPKLKKVLKEVEPGGKDEA